MDILQETYPYAPGLVYLPTLTVPLKEVHKLRPSTGGGGGGGGGGGRSSSDIYSCHDRNSLVSEILFTTHYI